MKSNWIKLSNWKEVCYPTVCPWSGLKANTTKEYIVENTSILWILIRILRVVQYITLEVPFNEIGKKEIKRQRTKLILKGLLIGSIFAIAGFIIGVYVAVEGETKFVQNLGISVGGTTFALSLFLAPVILLYKWHLKSSPIRFRKNNKQLWVKILNEDYRTKFKELNEDLIIPNSMELDMEIIDASRGN